MVLLINTRMDGINTQMDGIITLMGGINTRMGGIITLMGAFKLVWCLGTKDKEKLVTTRPMSQTQQHMHTCELVAHVSHTHTHTHTHTHVRMLRQRLA